VIHVNRSFLCPVKQEQLAKRPKRAVYPVTVLQNELGRHIEKASAVAQARTAPMPKNQPMTSKLPVAARADEIIKAIQE